jgi:hypothetical protein
MERCWAGIGTAQRSRGSRRALRAIGSAAEATPNRRWPGAIHGLGVLPIGFDRHLQDSRRTL